MTCFILCLFRHLLSKYLSGPTCHFPFWKWNVSYKDTLSRKLVRWDFRERRCWGHHGWKVRTPGWRRHLRISQKTTLLTTIARCHTENETQSIHTQERYPSTEGLLQTTHTSLTGKHSISESHNSRTAFSIPSYRTCYSLCKSVTQSSDVPIWSPLRILRSQ